MVNRILNYEEQKPIILGFMRGRVLHVSFPPGLFLKAAKYGERAAPQWKIGYPISLAFGLLLGAIYHYHRFGYEI